MALDIKVVMERIKTILAMAESPNEAEAATATEMAHKMLKEYNLTLSDIEFKEQAIIEETYEEYQRMPPWKNHLLMQICWTNYCDGYFHIIYSKRSHGGERTDSNRTWIIVGRQANVATVKVMADYLLATIERLTKRYEGTTAQKKSYKFGVASTLRARLAEMIHKEEAETETTALVVKESGLVQKHMAKKEIEKEKNTITITDMLAYIAGCKDGEAISLNTQVDSKVSKPMAALKE